METEKDVDKVIGPLMEKFNELRDAKQPAVMANPDKKPPTVTVVGAGISGVTAACKLAELGFHVVLLEARDRVGGRIQTEVINNTFVELGAQFMHGIKNNPLFLELSNAKVNVKPMGRDKVGIYDENGDKIDHQQLLPYIEKVKDKISGMTQERMTDAKDRFYAEELKDVVEQVQSISCVDHKYINELIEKISHHEFHKESLFSYKTGLGKKESENNFLVTSGFVYFLENNINQAKDKGSVEVHLLSEVSKISHHANDVKCELTNGKTFSSDALVCTLPLGVLQHGNVQFDPPLPEEKTKSIMKLKMADHDKLIMLFKKVSWPDYSHFVVPFDTKNKTWLDIVNLNYFGDTQKNPVLVASFHNHQAGSDEALTSNIKTMLQKIFKEDYQEPEQCWVTHWSDDPLSRGGYCFHPEDASLDDNTEIARPLGRVCFAGEHTHRAPASVQGAFLSGKEAAKQVVFQLHQILSSEKSA